MHDDKTACTHPGVGLETDEDVTQHTEEDHLVLEARPDLGQVDELWVDLGGGHGRLGLYGGLQLLHAGGQLRLEQLHLLGTADHIVLQEGGLMTGYMQLSEYAFGMRLVYTLLMLPQEKKKKIVSGPPEKIIRDPYVKLHFRL